MRYSAKTCKRPISGGEEWPKVLLEKESAKIQISKWMVKSYAHFYVFKTQKATAVTLQKQQQK